MSQRRSTSLLAPILACTLLAAWIALSAAGAQVGDFSVLIAILANFIVYTDAADLLLRLYARRRHTSASTVELSIDLAAASPAVAHRLASARPWAIVASIFNLESRGQLDDFMEALGRFRERVWLISDGSTDQTVVRLRQAGWRCMDDAVNRRKPGALLHLL